MTTLARMIRTLYQQAEWRSRMGQATPMVSLEWIWDRNAPNVRELLWETAGKKLKRPARSQ
jgi:hypothetical protein